MADKELQALTTISAALEGLDEAAVQRIVNWITSRHSLTETSSPVKKNGTSTESAPQYETFADFYDAANPQTENEKVLVAAYYLQHTEGKQEWDSQSANDALKNLGHPISNITRSLDRLQAEKPRLAMQTQKSGKSKQGRKLYKLTVEGIRAVRKMLQESTSGSEAN